MVLETIFSIKADIIIIQKLFIENKKIYHNDFNIYWPQKKRKEIRVITTIGNNFDDKIIIRIFKVLLTIKTNSAKLKKQVI